MQAGPDAQIMTDREAPARAPAARRKKPARPTEQAPDFVAENLRRLFREFESEALPDRFKDLLRRLEEEERRK